VLKFSIIIGFRNREYKRVKYSLDSLARQEEQNFELIFVDYGSKPNISAKIRRLVESYKFTTYIYTETRGFLWNKSEALNIGIMHAKGEYIVIADVDLIFCKNYTKFASDNITKDIFLTHRCYYLPQDYPLSKIINEKIGSNEKFEINFIGLMVVHRSCLIEIDGFDEFYQVWGAEDEDVNLSLTKMRGLTRKHIDVSVIPLWHQWHSKVSPPRPSHWFLAELNYLYCSKEQPPRNKIEKGRIYEVEGRLALQLYLSKNYLKEFQVTIDRKDHLAFLSFYQNFSQLKAGEMCYFEYKNRELIFDNGKLQKVINVINSIFDKLGKYFHYRLFREEHIRFLDTVKFKDIKEFIEYFIGMNRGGIEDYYYCCSEKSLILIIKKREMLTTNLY
jgi:glycosyltransferase involved in cell wall biosynthesis